MRKTLVLFIISYSSIAIGQQISPKLDDSFLLAETKQVGQFFRRFNSEEDFDGKRISRKDTLYRNPRLRKFYISNAFDDHNMGIDDEMKQRFIEDVVEKNAQFLDFHSGNWFAQVNAMFEYKGKLETGVLFLTLERENKGYKWVLSNIYFHPFVELFSNTESWNGKKYGEPKIKKYIHPKSHEMHFINLKSALNDTNVLEDYIENEHHPDFLTLFIFEMKKKELSLQSIQEVKFHFFQVDDWYFELKELRRSSKNSGWLISEMAYVTEKDKNLLKQYIFMKKNEVIP